MVYDDTRWVTKLQLMGVWNEIEARKRFEEAIKRRRASGTAKRAEEKRFAEARASGNPGTGTIASTLFDAVDEKKKTEAMVKKRITIAGGEGLMTALPPSLAPMRDKESLLSVICSIRSIRGFARQEFGRVYGALAPLYFDLVRARTHTDPIVFREYRNPEDQARMLAQLRTFSECDTAMGWAERLERLNSMMGVFENAALREFEGGYEACDFDDRMSRYAHVLFLLNGGQACIQLFVHKHPLLYEREELGNPMDCFEYASSLQSLPFLGHTSGADMKSYSNPEVGSFSLEPMTTFWEKLVVIMNHQINVIDRVFPPALNVLMPFLERISEDVITDFITPILDEAHEREIEQYLQAVTGILRQSLEFGASLQPGKNAPDSFRQDVLGVLAKIFDAHVDLYLQEELDYNKQKFEAEVDTWEKKANKT
jgi:recyclin-1